MLNWVKVKIANYKANKEKEEYNAGFEWVMVEYYLEKTSIENIKRMCYNPFDGSKLDKGARYAIKIIEESK